MPQANKDIKRRIKSIGNTKKITKAMELVAAAKMRKAVEKVQRSKTYATEAWGLAQNLASRVDFVHPLLVDKDIKPAFILAISANKGLCGGFNQQILAKALALGEKLKQAGKTVQYITLGKKCALALAARQQEIIADFPKGDIINSAVEIEGMKKMILKEFSAGRCGAVYLVYTNFVSAIKQVPSVIKLLPISHKPDPHLGHVAREESNGHNNNLRQREYKFEPDAQTILNKILPRLVTIQLYQAVLESNASEHRSRMVAMKNANDAANEMLDYLNLLYNRVRQDSITQEIAEISAGQLTA